MVKSQGRNDSYLPRHYLGKFHNVKSNYAFVKFETRNVWGAYTYQGLIPDCFGVVMSTVDHPGTLLKILVRF